MILTWIALGLAATAAVALIVTYWNEIVDWAKDVLDNIFQRGRLFLRWVDDTLIPTIKGIFNGKGGNKPGPTKPATREDLWKLYEEGVITYDELQILLDGGEISTAA
jgi:hypothetical protein